VSRRQGVQRGLRRRSLLLGLGAAAALVAAEPPSVWAKRPLLTGFAEARYYSADPATRAQMMHETRDAGASVALVFLSWRGVATGVPADPRDPADPAYDFSQFDATISTAAEAGLSPLVAVTAAPDFALGPNPPAGVTPGAWRPDPVKFGEFGEALARRYSGSFVPAAGQPPLPAVRLFQAWTEPNLDVHLAPQYDGKTPVAPSLYRALLNRFYEAVKEVNADNVVVTGGTAPYGDPPGGARTRPLRFWRDVLCLKDRRRLQPTNCPEKPEFDVLAHNPINTSGGPRRSALHPDDASTPDLDNLRRILRAAERHHRVASPGRHPLWATEVWWETDPPDSVEGVPLRRQARYLQEALHILWNDGAELVVNLQLRDTPFDVAEPGGQTSAGVEFEDGTPKPSLTAFRFPFVVDRTGPRRLEAWGRAPVQGELSIERRRGSRWLTVETLDADAASVFEANLRLSGKQELRATVSGQHSLVWTAH
jgi:hypothetical protein